MSEPHRASVVVSAVTDFSDANAASIHVLELARGFAEVGCRVHLVIPFPSRPQSIIAPAAGLPFTVSYYANLRRWGLPNAANHVPQLRAIRQAAALLTPDLIYLRSSPASAIAAAGVRLRSHARVITEHNGWLRDEAEGIGHAWPLCRAAEMAQLLDARVAQDVRVVTPAIGALLAAHGIDPAKIFHCGNGTNLRHFLPAARAPALATMNLDPTRRYLGFIGNLVAWQGTPVLIEAFRRIAARAGAWDLLIAGDGPDLPSLRRRVAETGLASRIKLLGAVPYACAPTVVSCFDIAVAPFSRQRNSRIGLSPLKIRDYAASGRPVVAADIAGLSELAAAGWMALHRPDDPVDLALRLTQLIDAPDERRRMGEAARAFAESNFGWERVAAAILERLPADRRGDR